MFMFLPALTREHGYSEIGPGTGLSFSAGALLENDPLGPTLLHHAAATFGGGGGVEIGVPYWGPYYEGILLFGVYSRGPFFS